MLGDTKTVTSPKQVLEETIVAEEAIIVVIAALTLAPARAIKCLATLKAITLQSKS